MSNQTYFAIAHLKDVQKVTDIAGSKVTRATRNAIKVSGFGERGSVDHSLPTYDQLILDFKEGRKRLRPGCSYTCLIRPDQVYTDLSYNRGEELSINKVKDNIVKYHGFEHKLAGAIQISIRPDGEGSYLFDFPITTKGNHRTSSAWLMEVPLIKADVFFHPRNFTHDQCVSEEASIHHGDCTDRSNQIPEQKFVSAVFAGQNDLFEPNSPEKRAVELNNFLNRLGYFVSDKVYGKNVEVPFAINPMETQKVAKKITSHDSISKSRVNYTDAVVKEVLMAAHEACKTNKIPANFIRSASLFFFVIEGDPKEKDGTSFLFCGSNHTPMKHLTKRTKLTSLEIKTDFMNFMFNECKPKITFEKITADSGKYKGPELYAARLLFYFNLYIQDRMSENSTVFRKSILKSRVRFLCPNDHHWQYIRSLAGSPVLGSFLDNIMTNGG